MIFGDKRPNFTSTYRETFVKVRWQLYSRSLLQVLEVLFQYIGADPAEDGGPRSATFCLVEKWRKIERPLQHASKVILSPDWSRDAILTSDWLQGAAGVGRLGRGQDRGKAGGQARPAAQGAGQGARQGGSQGGEEAGGGGGAEQPGGHAQQGGQAEAEQDGEEAGHRAPQVSLLTYNIYLSTYLL